MTTAYCTRTHIESILSPAGVLAAIDDDENGDESPEETAHVTNAINNAAARINQRLVNTKYTLANLTSNEWLKWTNAYFAVDILMKRRGNPAPEPIAHEVKERSELLTEVRWGRESLPEQNPDFDCLPTVSNFRPELFKIQNPIRVSTRESTGPTPDRTRHRNQAGDISPY